MRRLNFLVMAAILLHSVTAESVTIQMVRDEIVVNQSLSDNQDHATVAINEDGSQMVVWHDFGNSDGDGSAIMGRLIDYTGTPLTDEILINDSYLGYQRVPDVATSGTMPFVVTWNSIVRKIEGYDVYMKLYSPSGDALSDEIKITVSKSFSKVYPDVAMYPNGDFVVMWDQDEGGRLNYYIKFFDANGVLLMGPMKINKVSSDGPPDANGRYGLPDISVNSSGDAIAVWERINGADIAIAMRKFNPYYWTASQEFLVDAPPAGYIQRRPSVSINDAGDFVVSWTEHPNGDDTMSDVYVRKYNNSISKWGVTIRPHDNTDGTQLLSVVKLGADGEFVVVWTSKDTFYDDDIYMRFYSARNKSLSNELLVNTTQAGSQKRPAVDWYDYPDHKLMAVTWEGREGDGKLYGIFHKLYRINLN